jgi:ABC-type Fe3+-hydroxamate transport system substrate-binding protein
MKLVDQIGHQLSITSVPKRIISTVPSQTELLFYLGLKNQVVGRTRFCIHPKSEVKRVKNIGGTKQLKLDEIEKLKPDLIIANKEENEKDQIKFLQEKYPVYTSDILSIDSSLEMIGHIGELCHVESKAKELRAEIARGFNGLPKIKASVAYLIWFKPYMVSADDTFINEVLKKLGFKNVFANEKRYPEVDIEKLKEANADYIFLSSEPFPFKQKHIDELKTELPHSKIVLVDGEMFSWYGNRMLKAIKYFHDLIREL